MTVSFQRKTVIALLGALTLSGSLVGLVVTRSNSSPRVSRADTTAKPPTFVGSDGVEAKSIVEENNRPGSTNWQIRNAPKRGTIEGFANATYAQAQQTVALYVSTNAPRFRVEAYRMGYYQGKGARLVWHSPEIPGKTQGACTTTAVTNMVACDRWTASLSVRVSSAFLQGDYLLKLIGSGNQQSYIPLTVWDPSSHAAYLIKNDVYTWQAWNPFGGDDFYAGRAKCAPSSPPYPICSRARVVSFDRPYGYGQGAADFLSEEYPLVRFAEEHGLDVAYVTDLTIEQHPSVLSQYRALFSLGHDECWSFPERQSVQRAEQSGMNIVFFGASAVLRHVRLQASPLGSDREEVDYRNALEDPLNGKGHPLEVTGNTWSSPPASWPETSFVGATYAGFLEPGEKAPLVVANGSAWIFHGTGLHNGSAVPGVIASDFDEFESSTQHVRDEEIFAHSPIPSIGDESNVGGKAYSDTTYYTDPVSRAGVFDSGTNNWIPALSGCLVGQRCRPRTVGRITGNLFLVVGQGPAGNVEPSVANWQKISS